MSPSKFQANNNSGNFDNTSNKLYNTPYQKYTPRIDSYSNSNTNTNANSDLNNSNNKLLNNSSDHYNRMPSHPNSNNNYSNNNTSNNNSSNSNTGESGSNFNSKENYPRHNSMVKGVEMMDYEMSSTGVGDKSDSSSPSLPKKLKKNSDDPINHQYDTFKSTNFKQENSFSPNKSNNNTYSYQPHQYNYNYQHNSNEKKPNNYENIHISNSYNNNNNNQHYDNTTTLQSTNNNSQENKKFNYKDQASELKHQQQHQSNNESNLSNRTNLSEENKEKISATTSQSQAIGNLTHAQQHACMLNTSNEDFSKYYRQELVNGVRSSLGGVYEVC